MAIVTKKQKLGRHYYMHTYSDEDFRIMQDQTGIIYDDAWDVLDTTYTYTETEEKIGDDGEED